MEKGEIIVLIGWCVRCGKEIYDNTQLPDGFIEVMKKYPVICKDCNECWENKAKNIPKLEVEKLKEYLKNSNI